jgi:nucleoside diphosphate kinase
MAQEVSMVRPDAVERGSDGYLRVHYDRLGLKFQSYHDWAAAGRKIPGLR